MKATSNDDVYAHLNWSFQIAHDASSLFLLLISYIFALLLCYLDRVVTAVLWGLEDLVEEEDRVVEVAGEAQVVAVREEVDGEAPGLEDLADGAVLGLEDLVAGALARGALGVLVSWEDLAFLEASTACAAVVCCRNASAAVLVVDLVLPEDPLLPSESCDANLFYHYTAYLMKCVI
ncbi:hypothetical protein DVH24_027194 [Malus domestica]|uniref:Uncharacterized protein n=1 Tax=Malus domestica TaxID=3750 RepID=A0A498IQ81_MALDO|nr:hypothetical protein DVH24_027194 [Malus domestica]